jgi:hypothetical protein
MMASERQKSANRQNAQRSTGPKTAVGKARSRWNAVMHGLTAIGTPLLPGERIEDFDDLSFSLDEHFSPVGRLEEELVDDLTRQIWRLQRTYRVETGIFAWYMKTRHEREEAMQQPPASPTDAWETIRLAALPPQVDGEVETEVDAEYTVVERAVEDRLAASIDVGQAFITDAGSANALTKLSRYETTLRRGIERTVHQLGTLQRDRLGSPT